MLLLPPSKHGVCLQGRYEDLHRLLFSFIQGEKVLEANLAAYAACIIEPGTPTDSAAQQMSCQQAGRAR
jgi:hypothetical protein